MHPAAMAKKKQRVQSKSEDGKQNAKFANTIYNLRRDSILPRIIGNWLVISKANQVNIALANRLRCNAMSMDRALYSLVNGI
jgi:hypothetical protein